jgi:hypothetical protein
MDLEENFRSSQRGTCHCEAESTAHGIDEEPIVYHKGGTHLNNINMHLSLCKLRKILSKLKRNREKRLEPEDYDSNR